MPVAVTLGLADDSTTAVEAETLSPGDRVVLRQAASGTTPPAANPMLPGVGGGRRGR